MPDVAQLRRRLDMLDLAAFEINEREKEALADVEAAMIRYEEMKLRRTHATEERDRARADLDAALAEQDDEK